MSEKVRVTIAIADDHLDRVPAVVTRLRNAGVQIEQTLDSVGAIVGSVDEQAYDAVARVEGVGSIERERHFQLPPSDSPIQ